MDYVMAVAVVAVLIAHAGHWALSLVYVLPVILVIAFIFVSNRRDRQALQAGADADRPE